MEYRNNSFDTSIKDLEACERPREKMSLYGPQKLSDFELICIMLGSGSRNYPVNVLAKQILKVIDKVGDSRPLELESLESIPGLGVASASKVCAALELGRRRNPAKHRVLREPGDLFPLICHYAQRQQESFLVASLNGAMELIGVRVTSVGILDRTLVHPREIFCQAIVERASSIILAHNHPSGNLTPSHEDIEITKRLCQAGLLLGIKVVDHLVFSLDSYFSFLEKGLL